MYKAIMLLYVFFQTSMLFGQELSEIEKKYDFIEIWGLERQSKSEFLTQITSYPEGICQQSLTKMGYTDGNKISIPFSNKLIITLNNNPQYEPNLKFKKIKKKELKKWKKFRNKFAELGVYERQQVPFLLSFYLKDQKNAFDNAFLELSTEFKNYGINLDKGKVMKSLEVYSKYSSQFSGNDILSVLYKSKDKDSIRDAAIFIAPKFLTNETELLSFLPLLLNKGSGVQPLISAFIRDFEGQIDWENNMDLLTKLVNNPNPFQSLLALRIADKTGFSRENMKKLLGSEMVTMRNILVSRYLPEEDVNYLVVFINKYADFPIELNKEILMNYLR